MLMRSILLSFTECHVSNSCLTDVTMKNSWGNKRIVIELGSRYSMWSWGLGIFSRCFKKFIKAKKPPKYLSFFFF